MTAKHPVGRDRRARRDRGTRVADVPMPVRLGPVRLYQML
jgi:hypothetical protein